MWSLPGYRTKAAQVGEVVVELEVGAAEYDGVRVPIVTFRIPGTSETEVQAVGQAALEIAAALEAAHTACNGRRP